MIILRTASRRNYWFAEVAEIDYEIDLMIDKPEEEIDKWILAGASRLIVHIESTKNIQKIVDNINSRFAYPEKIGK
jgi:pentose-5-phosphate-3-epimerase